MAAAIHKSIEAVVERGSHLAEEVVKSEERVNEMEVRIDDLAIQLLALQQPMAVDLRLIAAALKINNDLERMGDLAVSIALRAIDLVGKPSIIPRLANNKPEPTQTRMSGLTIAASACPKKAQVYLLGILR